MFNFAVTAGLGALGLKRQDITSWAFKIKILYDAGKL